VLATADQPGSPRSSPKPLADRESVSDPHNASTGLLEPFLDAIAIRPTDATPIAEMSKRKK
jgi:hypothetical protein